MSDSPIDPAERPVSEPSSDDPSAQGSMNSASHEQPEHDPPDAARTPPKDVEQPGPEQGMSSASPDQEARPASDITTEQAAGENPAPEPPAVPAVSDTSAGTPTSSEATPADAAESPPASADESSQTADAKTEPEAPKPESVEASLAGKVARVTAEQIFLDLPDGRQGCVPVIEFVGQPIPTVGDEVSVMVDQAASQGDTLVLSKRQADELDFWQSVKPGDVLEGVVTGMNKGGLDVDIGGARAFLPASQVDAQRLRDISVLIGEHVSCVVTQVDRTTRDLVVSRRRFLDRQRKQLRAEAAAALQEGDRRAGKVTTLTDYGAFVDVGGVEGLLHINDMSWGRVRSPKEVLQPGQEIEVCVLKVNRENAKVALGVKQLKPDPWEGIEQRYPEGQRIKANVARMTDFGAFLELEEGVDALLPLGEMSWSRRVNHPSDVVRVGEEREVVVLKVDPARRRISVGLKQAEENPWSTVESKFPVNEKTTGKVTKVLDFGAFVELVPGVEGLIHISELSDKHVKAVGDVVQEGQEVEVRVLKVDLENQRVSLSMRPVREPAKAEQGEDRRGRPKKQRKRPLRGGLASHFEW